MSTRIGCDIGGTFTDLVLADAEHTVTHKVLTTPDSPAQGALAGLDELLVLAGREWRDVDEVTHGTTLVTNALISRIGVPTALLTTRGFRDVLGFGRQQRYNAYDLRLPYPKPLVPRRYCREIHERTLASGDLAQKVSDEEVSGTVLELLDEGIASFAVCYLHAYKNPHNERATADLIRKIAPEAVVSLSHEVSPVIREYERTATTAACAYTQPIASRYLTELRKGLSERGFGGRFLLMQSSGGTASAEEVERIPIKLLESGPAGGARAAAQVGVETDTDPVLSFDMGGTTAKACLVRAGEFDLSDHLEVGRLDKLSVGSGTPVYVPTLDLIEIGTGGGSIASVSRLGLLQVGPRSAGAQPGPVCYGFGGTEPTVTDANLVLGYLNTSSFAFPLDKAAAEASLACLAEKLGVTVEEAALGVRRHANENMAAAARMHLVEKGTDPRSFTLVASGGAGPLHAVDIASLLSIRHVVVPMRAGVMSAEGFLLAPSSYETAVSAPGLIQDVDWSEIEALYDTMAAQAVSSLQEAGVDEVDIEYERRADLKLLGQVHELAVPIDQLGTQVEKEFLTTYRNRFHLVPPDMPVEVLTWRLAATGKRPVGHRRPSTDTRGSSQQARRTEREVWCDGRRMAWQSLDRASLQVGETIHGPALIDDVDTTTVIRSTDKAVVDEHGNLNIHLENDAQ